MLDGAVKTFPREFVQRTDVEGKIGIVNQNIDRTELTLRDRDHLLDLVFVGHVGLNDRAAPPLSAI